MECWNDGMLVFYTELLYSQESRLVPVKTGNQCLRIVDSPVSSTGQA
jgi:hypothetical protein